MIAKGAENTAIASEGLEMGSAVCTRIEILARLSRHLFFLSETAFRAGD